MVKVQGVGTSFWVRRPAAHELVQVEREREREREREGDRDR
jgi:hypothetical protein